MRAPRHHKKIDNEQADQPDKGDSPDPTRHMHAPEPPQDTRHLAAGVGAEATSPDAGAPHCSAEVSSAARRRPAADRAGSDRPVPISPC
ncbi:hypothetical protein GCM10009682_39800 [Luedemannella flava]|uniref:Uncharacterized protein n=1 Tax=Luedemannella flava TaxID=349316 RepID=A0ABP4YJG2_9ACTN